jgi:putative ABC transport system permease protein
MWALLYFLSWRYWLSHRAGLALSALGVASGVAVFVAVQVANHSVLRAFESSLEAVSGRANLQIIGGARGLPESVYESLSRQDDPRVRALAPVLEKTLFSPSLKPTSAPASEGTSILVLGVDVFAQADFLDFDLQKAASPASASTSPSTSEPSSQPVWQFLLEPRAIAVSGSLAERFRVKQGDTLALFVGSRREQFQVAAIVRGEAIESAFGGDFALLDIAAAQESLGEVGRLSQIDAIVDEEWLAGVMRDWRARAGRGWPADVRVQRPAQRSAQVGELLQAFQLNLSALSCITLFVGAFLIYNTVAVAVVRRRREVGTLRAFGTPAPLLRRLFLVEAAIIGLIGSMTGALLGWLLARYTLGEVSRTVSTLYVAVKARELWAPAWLWPAAIAGGTLLSVLAAYPAAHEAGRVTPREALSRASLHQSAARWALPLAGLGLLVVGLGLVLCHPFFARRAAWVGFIATACTLGGFAATAPLLVQAAGLRVQKWGERLGVGWLLAGTYLQRAIHRTGLVVAALMVSLAMTIGLAVMVHSFRNTVADWVDNTISADLFVAPARGFSGDAGPGLPPEVVAFARRIEGVRAIDTIRGAQTTIGNQPVFIAANTLPALETGDRSIRFHSTRAGDQAALEDFRQARAILVSERFRNLIGLGAGQTVSLDTPQGPRAFPVAGVFYDYTPNEAVIYLPQKLYQKFWRDFATDGLALYLEPGADVEGFKRRFDREFGRRYTLTLLANREIRQSVFRTFDDTFAVTYALQLIAVAVASAGIFDTLLALLLERSRELAMLRATGASGGQVRRWILLEFALVGLLSWLLALIAGTVLAWQLISVINRQFFGWTIQPSLPPAAYLNALALALAAGLGAGLIPSLRAARTSLAESLRDD